MLYTTFALLQTKTVSKLKLKVFIAKVSFVFSPLNSIGKFCYSGFNCGGWKMSLAMG